MTSTQEFTEFAQAVSPRLLRTAFLLCGDWHTSEDLAQTKSRAVVVLRYWADLSVDQVAEVLGCSAGNVKSQSARALDKLRDVLGEAMTGVPASPAPEPQEKGGIHHG